MKKNMNKKGFTLVETMLVVAIIALLATVVTTVSIDAYKRSHRAVQNVADTENRELLVARNAIDGVNPITNVGSSTGIGIPTGGSGSGSGIGTSGSGSGSGSSGSTGAGANNAALPEPTEMPTLDGGTTEEIVAQLPEVFPDRFRSSGSALSTAIFSNRSFDINPMLVEAGITNADVSITNRGNANAYVTGILTDAGIPIDPIGNNGNVARTEIKIVSVTIDGTLLSEHNRNDTVQVRQYIYYKVGNEVICYGYRDTTATVGGTDNQGRVGVIFDQSDTDGSSWTRVG